MAKIGIRNAGKYQSSGNGGYFSLKDDGDSAVVRFLYNQPDGSDIDYFLVHEVQIDGKKRYVSCNSVDENGESHPDDCPLCKAGNKPKEKLFLQLVASDNPDSVQIWERGSSFVSKIITYLNEFGNLSAVKIKVIRRGKKGDQKTQYEFMPMGKDDVKLEDLPQKQELEGSLIIKANIDEMNQIIAGTYTPQHAAQQHQIQEQQFEPMHHNERGTRTTAPSDVF